jgi:hypothetical protein
MFLRNKLSLALWILGFMTIATPTLAQLSTYQLKPFTEFRNRLRTASVSEFVNQADVRVTDALIFEEMRQHLLSLYEGVDVTQSYELGDQVFDCVPIEQQPSARTAGVSHIAEPPPSRASRVNEGVGAEEAKQANDSFDRYGNRTECVGNTIPMRRITLEEITRFPSLRAFFAKSPGESGPPREGEAPCTGNCPHKYSITYQNISNQGGHSALNLWSPNVNTKIGEIFSLSQQWYVSGSGSNTQTAEIGWQNYPLKYGTNSSHLFIYHTADDYQHTGCYNLDCKGFVQTNKSVHLGGTFVHYSKSGGTQYEMLITVQHYKGNWWMYYGNTAFGYYPNSQYFGGAMTNASSSAQYGTESVQSGGTWPAEGSGAWPSAGLGYAAYQRYVYHYNSSLTAVFDSLHPYVLSPSCYKIGGPYFSKSAGWGEYFYEGGPGGKTC